MLAKGDLCAVLEDLGGGFVLCRESGGVGIQHRLVGVCIEGCRDVEELCQSESVVQTAVGGNRRTALAREGVHSSRWLCRLYGGVLHRSLEVFCLTQSASLSGFSSTYVDCKVFVNGVNFSSPTRPRCGVSPKEEALAISASRPPTPSL